MPQRLHHSHHNITCTLELWWGLNQLIHRVVGSVPNTNLGFPGGSDSKESACDAGGPDLISGSGKSPGEGTGNPLQYSCLENSMDRGAWWATVWSIGLQRVGHNEVTNTFTFNRNSNNVSYYNFFSLNSNYIVNWKTYSRVLNQEKRGVCHKYLQI